MLLQLPVRYEKWKSSLSDRAIGVSDDCTEVCNTHRQDFRTQETHSGNYFIFHCDNHNVNYRKIAFTLQSNPPRIWARILLANAAPCQMTLCCDKRFGQGWLHSNEWEGFVFESFRLNERSQGLVCANLNFGLKVILQEKSTVLQGVNISSGFIHWEPRMLIVNVMAIQAIIF